MSQQNGHSPELLAWLYHNELPPGADKVAFLRAVQPEMAAGLPSTVDPEIHVVEERDGWTLRVAIWRLAGREPRPVVIHYHGGGWQVGNHLTHPAICTSIANAGFDVVSVDYRRAPRHRFPAAFDDSRRALEWVLTEGTSVGLHPSLLALAGDSAGANLAAAVAGNSAPSAVRGLVAMYGIFDYHRAIPAFQRVGMAVDYLADESFEELRGDPRLSPERVASRWPRTLLVEAEHNWSTEESEAAAIALAAAGVEHERYLERGVGHGFLQAPLLPQFTSTMDVINTFLHSCLKTGGAS